MNSKYYCGVLLILLSALSPVWAQVGIFKDPANFSNDVSTFMAGPKTEVATNAGTGVVSVYGSASDAVKTKIFDITQKLYQKKKFKAPQFVDFYAALYAAGSKKNISQTDLDSLLYVTQKMVEKYDSKQITAFFTTIKNLFDKDALFVSTFNSLNVKGGFYKFRFLEAAPMPSENIDDLLKEEEKQDEELSELDDNAWETVEESTPQEPVVDESALNVGYIAPAQPAIEGAVIVFQNIDLSFQTQYETTELKGTSGSLRLKDNILLVKEGK